MDLSGNDTSQILANPFYVVTFADHVFIKHDNLSSKEDWVAANAYTIKDIGPNSWLEELLDVLSLPSAKYDGHDMTNLVPVVNVSDRLAGDHEPLVTREQWIQANEKMVAEIGTDAWLWRLLDVLETGGPEVA